MKRKWTWADKVVRSSLTSDGRWSKRIIECCPGEEKRERRSPRQRWDEKMREVCERVTWQREGRERHQWERMAQIFYDEWMSMSKSNYSCQLLGKKEETNCGLGDSV